MIYFDNAATTCVDPEVIRLMEEILRDHYGNPSSIHELGRRSRVVIEDARRTVADCLNVEPSTLFFTSCGTEAINTALWGAVKSLGVKNIITSPLEHHAVTHSLEQIQHENLAVVHHVSLTKGGHIDIEHLDALLAEMDHTLVCLMHANNEIGNLLPLEIVSKICKQHGAYFLADTVQSLGKYELDFTRAGMDIAACSAHKFHGPKGIGFLYIRKGLFMQPLLLGGGQERQMRSGTENIAGIAGLAKALKIALDGIGSFATNVWEVRDHLADLIKKEFPDAIFNNDTTENGLYNLLNVGFPKHRFTDMLLQQLDMEGICASGGSACASGATSVSPVLKAAGCDTSRPTIRFSFSKFNTLEETHTCIKVLKKLAK